MCLLFLNRWHWDWKSNTSYFSNFKNQFPSSINGAYYIILSSGYDAGLGIKNELINHKTWSCSPFFKMYWHVLKCFNWVFPHSLSLLTFLLGFLDWYLISDIFSWNLSNHIGLIDRCCHWLGIITGSKFSLHPLYVVSKSA